MLNSAKIKQDFPILRDKKLFYLDSGASSQKPKVVIDAIKNCYENFYANTHRGVYTLSEKSTEEYELVREKVAKFINAKSSNEIVFCSGCTHAINLAAYSWGNANVKKDDEIIISIYEHHANLIPWQELCKRTGAKLRFVPLTKNYEFDLTTYKKLLSPKTKLVAVSSVSNVLGTISPLQEIITLAHQKGAKVLVDAAQSIGHFKTDVKKLDCDFMAFSSHKMLGPTGVGVLYAKEKLLENMDPLFFGGEMIKQVSKYEAIYADTPYKFEGGTQNIADVIAFGKAIDYLQSVGMNKIEAHDQKLLKYAREKFAKFPEVTIYAPKEVKKTSGVLSFSVKGVHPHDVASIFAENGVCIRAGHHCAHPLIESLRVPGTARLSFYFYNTFKDIDQAEKALKKTIWTFTRR